MKKDFIIGDSVIALSSANRPNQPRIKGNEYTVTDIFYCSTTGEQMININNTPSVGKKKDYIKCGCGKLHFTGMPLAYTYSKRFVLNDPEAIQNELATALDNEDYETAIIIRDIIL